MWWFGDIGASGIGMATTTAQAMIGQAHPKGGGITPTHLLFLTEDEKLALDLYRINTAGTLSRLGTWTPTIENLIEDLMLVAGALTGAQPEVARALEIACAGSPRGGEINCLGDSGRAGLYALSRKAPVIGKIVLTVLEDSSLIDQVGRLREYEADCELCVSARAKSVPIGGTHL
jgi:hypothetical protein